MVTIVVPAPVTLGSSLAAPAIPVPDQAFLTTCTPYALACVGLLERTWDTNRSPNFLQWGRADGVAGLADGTRVFLGSNLAPAQHDVDIAWVIPTGTVEPNAGSMPAHGSNSSKIFQVKTDDGTRCYRGDSTVSAKNRAIHGFTLDTAWDITGVGAIDQTFDYTANGASGDLHFSISDDGNHLYHKAGATGNADTVHIAWRNLTTAWDVSTATSPAVWRSFQATWSSNQAPQRWFWRPDGLKLWVVHGSTPDTTAQYDVPTAWEIDSIMTSGTSTSGFPIAVPEEIARHPQFGVTGGSSHTLFGLSGARMYAVDAAGTDVWQFPVTIPADVDVTGAVGDGAPVMLEILVFAPVIVAAQPAAGVGQVTNTGYGGRPPQRVGQYWMQDDESGLIYWDDDMVKLWDGSIRHWRGYETRHPQEFVQARADPAPLRHIRPDDVTAVPDTQVPMKVGATSVSTLSSPAGHIFGQPQNPQPVTIELVSPVQMSVLTGSPTVVT